MKPRFATSLEDAVGPFVLGLDVGSGGSRAGLYDGSGREVGKGHHKVPHLFDARADGTSTIDADQIVEELCEAMQAVLAEAPAGSVKAIGFDTFASSLVVVDEAGNALTPCITYADTRCHRQADALRAELDGISLHERTGARIHSSYNAPRLRWLREEHPDIFGRAHRFMALGEYVAFKLLGKPVLGTASAAWGGLIDRRTGEYVPELLEVAGVRADQLTNPSDPSEVVPISGTPLAQRLPELADAVWVPVVGDGLTANIGIGAFGPGIWGISTATSGAIRQLVDTEMTKLPGGLWAYRVDAHRTLTGSAMSDCGRVLDFARNQFKLPQDVAEIDTARIFTADPTAGIPLVVPFLSGERGTKWRDSARAVFAGVSASTTAEDLLRGSFEGLALSYMRMADQLIEVAGQPERVVLSGGMTGAVPAWLQILADALQKPIEHVAISRSTMRGSAVLALEQIDPAGDLAEIPVQRIVEPNPAHADYYRERLARFEILADVA
ncbi:gluconokinase [Brachybacterium sp. JHP9]|uniref:Gluconokinase n=1 Tax=Brachybacterium equifaecis TaxID=2910770 RepID=A0ABT0R476_9MICO|nr:gluconokinase [Brachybacterium equifaecis]MCL6424293.1 gluconokinase [Brachybacterium equifaecis]